MMLNKTKVKSVQLLKDFWCDLGFKVKFIVVGLIPKQIKFMFNINKSCFFLDVNQSSLVGGMQTRLGTPK